MDKYIAGECLGKGDFRHKKIPTSFEIGIFKFGADTKSRTRDLLITSQLLYQLSYVGELVVHYK